MDALSPRLCFVGVMDWRVIQMLKGFVVAVDWWSFGKWTALIVIGVVIYFVVVWALWYWFLESHDHRTSYERWLDQKEDDAAQKEYLDSLEEKRKKKK